MVEKAESLRKVSGESRDVVQDSRLRQDEVKRTPLQTYPRP